MRLVMFDVDDTLLKGDGIDSDCYCEAVEEMLRIGAIDTDWSHYSKVTDWGITEELIETVLKRKAKQADIDAVRRAYLEKLEDGISRNPKRFHAIAGAPELLAQLRAIEGLCVCVATGGWGDAAVLKLKMVGIPAINLPFASSDDSDERTEIMLTAHNRALLSAG